MVGNGVPSSSTYYLTCPRAIAAVGTLESDGMMAAMMQRLRADAELRVRYHAAHQDYLARRAAIEAVPELAGTSAGGMPERVKCLHVLVAHSLAVGHGVNPLGDEALAALEPWGQHGPCVDASGTDMGRP